MFRTLIASLACSCVTLLAPGLQAQVLLQPRPLEGARAINEATMRLDQKLTIAGMETMTDAETVTRQKQATTRNPSGKLQTAMETESFRVSMNAGGMNYSFDSAKPDDRGTSALDGLLRDVHKVIAKRKMTLVYDDKHRVESVQFDQDLLGGLPVQTQDLVRSELSPDAVKEAANQRINGFPDQPVQPGDSWQRTETVRFGGGQVMTFETKYTYEGEVEKDGRKLDKIVAQPQSVTFAIENSPLPLKLKDSDLKADGSRETMLFDREKGFIVESQGELRVVGDLTFEANNMELPAQLDLTMRSTENTVLQE